MTGRKQRNAHDPAAQDNAYGADSWLPVNDTEYLVQLAYQAPLTDDFLPSPHGFFANSETAIEPVRFELFNNRWSDANGTASGSTANANTPGSGGVISWSIAGAGLLDMTGQPANDPFFKNASVALDSFLAFDFTSVLRAAFEAWASFGNIEFIQVADGDENFGVGTQGTIRIGSGDIDGDSGTLAQAFGPFSGAVGGDLVFDSGEVGFWDAQSFFRVAVHEIGHSLGLDHEPAPPTGNLAIMNPFYNAALNGLQTDDINGIRALYGTQDFGANNYFMRPGEINLTLIDNAPQLTVFGNASANTIIGSIGAESISGGGANDTLNGLGGSDILTGGAADDLFVVGPGSGADTITDFVAGIGGIDEIDLRSFGFIGTSASFFAGMVQNGADTILNLGGGTTLTLQNVARTSLDISDFLANFSTTSGADNDFDRDGDSDMPFRSAAGDILLLSIENTQVQSGAAIGSLGPEWQDHGAADFDRDGDADILFRKTDGTLLVLTIETNAVAAGTFGGTIGLEWQVSGIADFDRDGDADILFRKTDGTLLITTTENNQVVAGFTSNGIGAEWLVESAADFDRDGDGDILFRRGDGAVGLSLVQGQQIGAVANIGQLGIDWDLAGTGDFDRDDDHDIIFHNANGSILLLGMEAGQIASGQIIGSIGAEWSLAETGDYDRDGDVDMFWRADGGSLLVFTIEGQQITGGQIVGQLGTEWHVI